MKCPWCGKELSFGVTRISGNLHARLRCVVVQCGFELQWTIKSPEQARAQVEALNGLVEAAKEHLEHYTNSNDVLAEVALEDMRKAVARWQEVSHG